MEGRLRVKPRGESPVYIVEANIFRMHVPVKTEEKEWWET